MGLSDFDKNLAPVTTTSNNIMSKDPSRQTDAMKAISAMANYAKVVTVRDRQLEERKFMEDIYRRKEQKMDLMMEYERLKELKMQKDKEDTVKRINKEGCKVLIEQIQENEHERLRRKDILDKEKACLQRQLELMEAEDKRIIEFKKQEAIKMVKEVEIANEKAKILKEKKAIEQKEEDLKILKYVRDKARREEEILREKKRIQEEKERETQLLREKQERANDKQAELDAAKAKRAYEENERKAREKEEADFKRHQEMIMAIEEENRKQDELKERLKREELEKERNEYNKIIQRQQDEMAKELEKEKLKKIMRMDNRAIVERQIKDLELNKIKQRNNVLEEGKNLRNKLDNYYKDLDEFRNSKIRELEGLNVNDKYIADLKKFNIYKENV